MRFTQLRTRLIPGSGSQAIDVIESKTVMIKALIFDYGNVLSRTLNLQPRTDWETRLGLQPGQLQRVVHNETSWVEAQCGRLSVDAYWSDIGRQLKLETPALTQLRADFYRSDLRNDELVDYIAKQHESGIKTAILSNFSLELKDFLDQQALFPHFDQVAISADMGVMKPAVQAYQVVLDMLDLPAANCVFIDDLPPNIDGAQAIGLQGVVFRDNPSCIAELTRLINAH